MKSSCAGRRVAPETRRGSFPPLKSASSQVFLLRATRSPAPFRSYAAILSHLSHPLTEFDQIPSRFFHPPFVLFPRQFKYRTGSQGRSRRTLMHHEVSRVEPHNFPLKKGFPMNNL